MLPDKCTLLLLFFTFLHQVWATGTEACIRCTEGTMEKTFYINLLTNHSAPFRKDQSNQATNTKPPRADELFEAASSPEGISVTFVTVGDDAYVYRGQVDSRSGDRNGVGFVIGKAFPLLYIGGWHRGYKQGFGVNIDFCGGNFVLQAGMWSQGLFYRTAAMPGDLQKILTELSGCVDVMAVLERALPFVPSPDIPDWAEEGEEEFLQNRGVYFINLSESKYAVDVYGGSKDDGAMLIQYSGLHGGENQQFIARRVSKNTFCLSPKHAPCKAMDLKSESTLPNIQIVQNTANLQKPSQQWTVERNPDDTFSLRNCYSKLYLMAKDKGSEMIQAERDNHPNQRFLFRKVSMPLRKKASPALIKAEKEYMLRNRHDGKFLDVKGGSTSNSTPILAWNGHGGNNQVFRFIPVDPADSNAFFIESALSKDKVLDVADNKTEDGAAVILYKKHGGRNQQWKLNPIKEKGEDDDVQIQSLLSHKCLEVTCKGEVRMASCDSSKDSQIFSLQKREIAATLSPDIKYRINIRANSKRLAVDTGSRPTPAAANAIVQQLPMAYSNGQVFQFVQHGQEVYSVFPEGAQLKLALSPFQPGTKALEGVILRPYDEKDTLFRWKLIDHNGIYFYLQNVKSGMFLEAAGDSPKVYQNAYGQKAEQLFAFEPVVSGQGTKEAGN